MKNKIQNEGWTKVPHTSLRKELTVLYQSLNHLQQNLRSLIKCEQEAAEKNQQEIATIVKSSGTLFQMIWEKIDNHLSFLKHIRQELSNKDFIAKRLTNIDEVMETSAIGANERLDSTYGYQKNPGEEKKVTYKGLHHIITILN